MKTFYTSEREIWREWLVEHFEIESEVWFVFPMKESGDKALSYNDAVEEALCFGWIDSTTETLRMSFPHNAFQSADRIATGQNLIKTLQTT